MKFELDDPLSGFCILLNVGCLYSLFVSFLVTYLCLTPFQNEIRVSQLLVWIYVFQSKNIFIYLQDS